MYFDSSVALDSLFSVAVGVCLRPPRVRLDVEHGGGHALNRPVHSRDHHGEGALTSVEPCISHDLYARIRECPDSRQNILGRPRTEAMGRLFPFGRLGIDPGEVPPCPGVYIKGTDGMIRKPVLDGEAV